MEQLKEVSDFWLLTVRKIPIHAKNYSRVLVTSFKTSGSQVFQNRLGLPSSEYVEKAFFWTRKSELQMYLEGTYIRHFMLAPKHLMV